MLSLSKRKILKKVKTLLYFKPRLSIIKLRTVEKRLKNLLFLSFFKQYKKNKSSCLPKLPLSIRDKEENKKAELKNFLKAKK